MKRLLHVLMAIAFVIFSINLVNVEAATLGKPLLQPEEGWKRYDNLSPEIQFSGPFVVDQGGSFYNGSSHRVQSDGKASFTFTGSKLRIIGSSNTASYRPSKVGITIDGQDYKYTEQGALVYQSLVFEKLDLPPGKHTVTITGIEYSYAGGASFYLDAIEIDDTGELIDSTEITVDSLKLNKATLEMNVGSSESLVATITPENATNKNIKWTSSIPEIASVDSNGNVIGLKAGKVIITATTTDGSNLTAKVEVTVKEAEVGAERAILRLTTTAKNIHEYDLSISEIDQFINWIDGRELKQGKPYYKFKLNVTTGNISSRTEYIMYDQIVSFTIDEYK